MDSYAAAEKMGIKLKKEWLATLDGRTRHSHAALDGEKVGTDEKFSNGCRFPGDPQGRPGEVYNCRCTMVAALDDVDTSGAQRRTRDGLIPDMTYAQWEASKQGYSGRQLSPYNIGGNGKTAEDVTKKYLDSAKPRMGKVRYERGYHIKGHKAEIEVANQLRDQFGGKIVLLKEARTPGIKTPDMLWKGKQWEIKSISTEKAADSALRKAIKQIQGNQGGVIFDIADGLDKQKLIDVLDARATRSKSFNADIIALRNGNVLFVRRYKK